MKTYTQFKNYLFTQGPAKTEAQIQAAYITYTTNYVKTNG